MTASNLTRLTLLLSVLAFMSVGCANQDTGTNKQAKYPHDTDSREADQKAKPMKLSRSDYHQFIGKY